MVASRSFDAASQGSQQGNIDENTTVSGSPPATFNLFAPHDATAVLAASRLPITSYQHQNSTRYGIHIGASTTSRSGRDPPAAANGNPNFVVGGNLFHDIATDNGGHGVDDASTITPNSGIPHSIQEARRSMFATLDATTAADDARNAKLSKNNNKNNNLTTASIASSAPFDVFDWLERPPVTDIPTPAASAKAAAAKFEPHLSHGRTVPTWRVFPPLFPIWRAFLPILPL